MTQVLKSSWPLSSLTVVTLATRSVRVLRAWSPASAAGAAFFGLFSASLSDSAPGNCWSTI